MKTLFSQKNYDHLFELVTNEYFKYKAPFESLTFTIFFTFYSLFSFIAGGPVFTKNWTYISHIWFHDPVLFEFLHHIKIQF